jgi:hypothetical protein
MSSAAMSFMAFPYTMPATVNQAIQLPARVDVL